MPRALWIQVPESGCFFLSYLFTQVEIAEIKVPIFLNLSIAVKHLMAN